MWSSHRSGWLRDSPGISTARHSSVTAATARRRPPREGLQKEEASYREAYAVPGYPVNGLEVPPTNAAIIKRPLLVRGLAVKTTEPYGTVTAQRSSRRRR